MIIVKSNIAAPAPCILCASTHIKLRLHSEAEPSMFLRFQGKFEPYCSYKIAVECIILSITAILILAFYFVPATDPVYQL